MPDEEIGKLARISHRVSAPHISLRKSSDTISAAEQTGCLLSLCVFTVI